MSDVDYGPARPEELEPLNLLLGQALHFPPGEMAAWTAGIGNQHLRAVRRAGAPVAGLSIIPMGHYFGGRPVPTAGITAVGVAPEARGSGVGLAMLRAMLEEVRAAGTPLSSLYPATTAFYRRAGYERAAARTIYELPLAALDVREASLETAPAQAEDEPAIRDLYARRAASAPGFIDRPTVLWDRALRPTHQPGFTYLARRDGTPEGYVAFTQGSWGDPLTVRDVVALTPAAGRRLLAFLGGHRSVMDTIRLPGAPSDPLLSLLPEQRQKVFRAIDLMLRVVDVPAALAARGYPPGIAAELHFDVTDDLLPANSGRFVLQVRDGRGQVERGGAGSIRLHIRGLAALYSGYLAAEELVLAGSLAADSAALAVATLVFAGPRPWLPDMF